MPTYLSAIVTVKNPEKLKEYISQVPATMAPFGAKLVFRGKVQTVLAGDGKHQIEAIFEFESRRISSLDSNKRGRSKHDHQYSGRILDLVLNGACFIKNEIPFEDLLLLYKALTCTLYLSIHRRSVNRLSTDV